MTRACIAPACLLVLALAAPAQAPAAKIASTSWKVQANLICSQGFAAAEPAVLSSLLALEDATDEGSAATALATFLSVTGRVVVRVDDELARLRVPRRDRARFRRLLDRDRRINGRIPLKLARILREGGPDAYDREVGRRGEALDREALRVQREFGRMGLRDCAGEEVTAG